MDLSRRGFIGTLSLTPLAFKELLGIQPKATEVFGKGVLPPWKIVYKETNVDFRSVISNILPENLILTYKTGKFLTAPNGKIFTWERRPDPRFFSPFPIPLFKCRTRYWTRGIPPLMPKTKPWPKKSMDYNEEFSPIIMCESLEVLERLK